MTIVRYANVYRPINGACGGIFESRELADQMAGGDRVACVRIEFELGDGLDARSNTNDGNDDRAQ